MTTTDKTLLRGALIGCAFFGQSQAEGWSRTPGAQIVAACDPEPERARSVSPNLFTDPEQMLAATELDFVDIAARPTRTWSSFGGRWSTGYLRSARSRSQTRSKTRARL